MDSEIQKQFICSQIVHLDRKEKIHVLEIIMSSDKNKLETCSDGTRVNLNRISNKIILEIYNYINYRIEQNGL